MEQNQYGLVLKIEGGDTLEKRFDKPLHDVKSLAGRAFHCDPVQSVCVYDADGVARLYLKKTANGVHREER